jgi:peptide deformylase
MSEEKVVKNTSDDFVQGTDGITFTYKDLEENSEPQVEKEPRLDPLNLYDDQLPLLSKLLPDYTESLPNSDMNTLIARMKMTMKKFGGIGLSANQCNVPTRMFIIEHKNVEKVCINPRIIAIGRNDIKLDEGCLSYPGLILSIKRAEDVDVEYKDENGKTVVEHLDGLIARCFLHELDHMNGIKFTAKVSSLVLSLANKKKNKLMKTEMRRNKNNGN